MTFPPPYRGRSAHQAHFGMPAAKRVFATGISRRCLSGGRGAPHSGGGPASRWARRTAQRGRAGEPRPSGSETNQPKSHDRQDRQGVGVE
jgi:hypothetical protein